MGGITGEFFMSGRESQPLHLRGRPPDAVNAAGRFFQADVKGFQCDAVACDGMFYRAKRFRLANFVAEFSRGADDPGPNRRSRRHKSAPTFLSEKMSGLTSAATLI